jgi:hypothetical protein
MFQPAHELDVVPFLGLLAQTSADRRLRISAAMQTDWLLENLREDFAGAAGLASPWLTRLELGTSWATYALPSAPGVTLSSLWRTLGPDERGWLTISLLKTLLPAGPVPMHPRSGVLCDARGQLWLVPPFRRCVEGASKTWDPWHFEEYALGGFSEVPTHGLAITLCRLLLEVPLTELYSLRTSPTPVPSARLAWLAPLDPLVAEAIDDLVARRPPSPTAASRWAATLAVLEDQCQQGASSGLGALVSRAWPSTPQRHRWE